MTTQHRENHVKIVKAMKYVAEGKTSWEPMDFGTMTFLCEWKKWAFESKLNFVCYVRKLELEVATLQTEVLFKCSFLSSRYTKDIRVNGLRTVWQVLKILNEKKWCVVFCTWNFKTSRQVTWSQMQCLWSLKDYKFNLTSSGPLLY